MCAVPRCSKGWRWSRGRAAAVLTGPCASDGMQNGVVTWEISVTDDQAAEALTVVEFSRKKHELEEIFLSLVEGGTDGR